MVATALVSILLIGSLNAFSPNPNIISPPSNKKHLSTTMSAERPTGSFFNPVPDDGPDDEKKDGASSNSAAPVDPFEKSIEDLISNRNRKPIASEPSTLGGIPTAKATGMSVQMCRVRNMQVMHQETMWIKNRFAAYLNQILLFHQCIGASLTHLSHHLQDLVSNLQHPKLLPRVKAREKSLLWELENHSTISISPNMTIRDIHYTQTKKLGRRAASLRLSWITPPYSKWRLLEGMKAVLRRKWFKSLQIVVRSLPRRSSIRNARTGNGCRWRFMLQWRVRRCFMHCMRMWIEILESNSSFKKGYTLC